MKSNYLTVPEISEVLGVSASVVSSWVEDGSLRAGRGAEGGSEVAELSLVHLLLRKGMAVPRAFQASVSLLIIDDEPEMLRSIGRLLRRNAPHVGLSFGVGAASALSQISALRPDAVLLDMHMPDLNGVDLCRMIKQQPETAGVLVVAFSGQRDPSLESDFKSAGAAAVLDKPPDVAQLLRVLESASLAERMS